MELEETCTLKNLSCALAATIASPLCCCNHSLASLLLNEPNFAICMKKIHQHNQIGKLK